MPFVSEPYIAAADHEKIEQLLSGHLPLGEHPETGDVLLMSEDERFAGIYLSGVQGSGKSALLANLILRDAKAGKAAIVIDPHGDLARSCIERLPVYAVVKTHLLDMEDEEYPFGVNGLGGHDVSTSLKLARAVDLCMHSFEAVWPEILKQHYAPKFLRAAVVVLLANPGMTLVDMRHFLLDDRFRDDGREMAHLFHSKHAEVRPEDIDPHPVEYLITYGSDDHDTQQFANIYLRSLQSHKRGGQIEVYRPASVMKALSTPQPPLTTRVADPTVYLNNLLYEVMTTGNPNLRIPHQVVYGYSGYGHGFYNEFQRSLRKEWLLSSDIWFPSGLVVEAPDGTLCWTRAPENSAEQLWHFLFTLRMTMAYLAEHPIGKRTVLSTSEVAQMLTELPHRVAFVRSGEDVGVIYTSDLPPAVPEAVFEERLATIQGQTREKYCTSKAEVEDRFLKSTEKDTNTSADTPLRRWEEL